MEDSLLVGGVIKMPGTLLQHDQICCTLTHKSRGDRTGGHRCVGAGAYWMVHETRELVESAKFCIQTRPNQDPLRLKVGSLEPARRP